MAYTLTWTSKGTIVAFSGKVTFDEITNSNDEHYGDERFDKIAYMLYDFSNADISGINMGEPRVFAAIDSAADIYKKNMKVALVGNGERTLSLFREYIEFSQRLGSSWTFAILDRFEDAINWCEER